MTSNCSTEKVNEYRRRSEMALRNNCEYISELRNSRSMKLAMLTSPSLRRAYAAYEHAPDDEIRLKLAAEFLNKFDNNFFRRQALLAACRKEDKRIEREHEANRYVIDNSDPGARDYYSVATIVKNEGRFIREFILFYLATGAERIYVYDNESTDNLLEELKPFISDGRVVYIRWPGQVVQTAAYRDVVRRTNGRSKWLAIIDADEFLFSPEGLMPDVLRRYEKYPGVCANWLLYGPNGHEKRPAGLLMDNYTTTIADHDYFLNCHIKTIVQPDRVLLTNQTHFSYYKNGEFAVDEDERPVDNRNAYARASGRAFTAVNHCRVFRINHYMKSIEDMEAKCRRGFADGAPNAKMERLLIPFREPMAEDLAIKPYADIVRKEYEQRHD